MRPPAAADPEAFVRPQDIPVLKDGVELVALPDGRLLVRHGEGHTLRAVVEPGHLAALLEAVDGRRTAAEIADLLADRFEPADVLSVLANLSGDVLETMSPAPLPPTPLVLLVGDGVAALALESSIRAADLARVARWSPPLVAAPDPPRLRFPSATPEAAPSPDLLRAAELVICCLEGRPAACSFALQQACSANWVPLLFLEQSAGKTRLGPTLLPGLTACLACAWLQTCASLDLPPRDLVAAMAALANTRLQRFDLIVPLVLDEVRAILAGDPTLCNRLVLLAPDGTRRDRHLIRQPACPQCAAMAPPPEDGRPAALAAAAERAAVMAANQRPRLTGPRDKVGVRRVGILGGGTAGYLTALALRAKHPDIDVTLIESSKVPVIGVGEATTPLMPQFLHLDLGLDIHEFFAAVAPTFKLGIRFFWGQAGESWFNYPFGPNQVLEPLSYDGRLTDASLQSMMMDAGVLPISNIGGTRHCGLDTEVAYHLDNRRFVSYLKHQARRSGVHLLDAEIVEARTDPRGTRIEGLLDTAGTVHAFDFYVDCSGFRALLLEHALGSDFVSYERSLFTDRALIGAVPNRGPIVPYTLAETMSSGWCWNTPQREEDHRGYVFSSAWLSADAAEAEMRAKNPGLGEVKLIRFRAGRHRHFWKGNVVAMGNAYGFVEPLESTALHLLIRQIGLFVAAFPLAGDDPGLAALLNRKVNAWWDYLAWFLALHYKFNRKLETPFWQTCRRDVDVAAHAELIEIFRDRGPLVADPVAGRAFDYPDPLWGAAGIDVILAGQQAHAHLPRPRLSRAEWQAQKCRARAWVARNLPQRQALELLTADPRLLDRFVARFQAVGSAF